MCFSNIKIKDGPIYFANLRQCKKQIMTKINEIEEKKKKFGNLWKKLIQKYTLRMKNHILVNMVIFLFLKEENHIELLC